MPPKLTIYTHCPIHKIPFEAKSDHSTFLSYGCDQCYANKEIIVSVYPYNQTLSIRFKLNNLYLNITPDSGWQLRDGTNIITNGQDSSIWDLSNIEEVHKLVQILFLYS